VLQNIYQRVFTHSSHRNDKPLELNLKSSLRTSFNDTNMHLPSIIVTLVASLATASPIDVSLNTERDTPASLVERSGICPGGTVC
jgi:hypothetical protein